MPAYSHRFSPKKFTALRLFLNARYVLLNFRHCVELHLCGPRTIDRPGSRTPHSDIEREVRDQDVVAVEDQTFDQRKPIGAPSVYPAEVAELGDHSPCFGSSTMISLD